MSVTFLLSTRIHSTIIKTTSPSGTFSWFKMPSVRSNPSEIYRFFSTKGLKGRLDLLNRAWRSDAYTRWWLGTTDEWNLYIERNEDNKIDIFQKHSYLWKCRQHYLFFVNAHTQTHNNYQVLVRIRNKSSRGIEDFTFTSVNQPNKTKKYERQSARNSVKLYRSFSSKEEVTSVIVCTPIEA